MYSEVQVAFQVSGVNHVNDRVGAPFDDKIAGNDFFWGKGREAVRAGEIDNLDGDTVMGERSLFLLYRFAGPVAHVLVLTGQRVEDAALPRVGVTGQGHGVNERLCVHWHPGCGRLPRAV